MPQAKSNDEMNSWLAAILDASELAPADKEVMKAEAHIVAAVGDDGAPSSPPGPRVRHIYSLPKRIWMLVHGSPMEG